MADVPMKRQFVLSPAAARDIDAVLRWSLEQFGAAAAARYRALVIQALLDLEIDPLRPGSAARPELAEGARTYHLAFSRQHVVGVRVKTPRHFLLYRVSVGRIEIGRVLHDQRDLSRHLPKDFGV